MAIAPTISCTDLGCGTELDYNQGPYSLTYDPYTLSAHSLMKNTIDPKAVPITGCGLEVWFSSDQDESDRQAWADTIRGDILERLAGKDGGWWLNMRGDVAQPYPGGVEGQIVWRRLIEVLAEEAGQRYDGQCRPWQYWQSVIAGNKRHDFVYVAGHAVRSTVLRYWGHATHGLELEGCCVRDAERMRAFDWIQGDPISVGELLDRCDYLMLSFPSEYRHFYFLSSKYSPNQIRERIELVDLERQIALLAE